MKRGPSLPKRKALIMSIAASCFIIAIIAFIVALNLRPIRDSSYKAYLVAKNNYLDGDMKAAEAILERTVKKEPKLFQAGLLLARTYFFQGKYKEADATLGKILKKYPLYHEAGLWKARTEIQLGKLKEARSRIEELLSWQSDDPRLLYYMGKISETENDIRSALDYYNRAALYEEENGKTRLEMGRLYWKLEMPDRALEEIERAIVLLPEDSLLATPAKDIKARIERTTANGVKK